MTLPIEDSNTAHFGSAKKSNNTRSPLPDRSVPAEKLPAAEEVSTDTREHRPATKEHKAGAQSGNNASTEEGQESQRMILESNKMKEQLNTPSLEDSLEMWHYKEPKNWTSDDVMNWIYCSAERLAENIDDDLLCGEAFRNTTGEMLCKMSKEDWVKRDSKYGETLYEDFAVMTDMVSELIGPEECEPSTIQPFLLASLGCLPELDGPEVTLSSVESDWESLPTSKCVHNLFGHPYEYEDNNGFLDIDVQEVPVFSAESRGTSRQANKDSVSDSSVGSVRLPLLSSSSYDATSLMSNTTDNSSLENQDLLSQLDLQDGNDDKLIISYPRSMVNPLPAATQQHFAPPTYPGISNRAQQHLSDPQPQPHHTEQYLQQRGFRPSPQSGLFYKHTEAGPIYPGVGNFSNSQFVTNEKPVDYSNVIPRTTHQFETLHSMGNHQQVGYGHPTFGGQCKEMLPPKESTSSPKAKRESRPSLSTKLPKRAPKKTTCKRDPDKPPGKRGRKKGQLSKDNHLWRFLLGLLQDNEKNPEYIRWEDKSRGIFTIVNSAEVAGLWGEKKKNPKMTYEKMSRAIRFCKIPGYIKDAPKDGSYPKKLCYAFGDNTTGWQPQSGIQEH